MKLTAETMIHGDLETLWALTQTPEHHVRWDMRFTDIGTIPTSGPGDLQKFRYATRIGFGKAIEGWGETIPAKDHGASTLRFGSDDAKSLISEGAGYWSYKPVEGGVNFSTAYDYHVRYGRPGAAVDRLVFRPLMVWATRWSFDRLRLWIEKGIAPELSIRLWFIKLAARTAVGLVWILEGLIPKLLWVSSEEVELVGRSGMFWISPAWTLGALGIAEILAGLWMLYGRAERLTMAASILFTIAISSIVVMTDPSALANPLGGISKNLALIACAVAVFLLSSISPAAKQAGCHQGEKP